MNLQKNFRCPGVRNFSRRKKIGIGLLLTVVLTYGAYRLWIPAIASGQPPVPTREYVYLDGKAVAVEE